MNPLKYAHRPTLLLPRSPGSVFEESLEIGNDTFGNVSRRALTDLCLGKKNNPIARIIVDAVGDVLSLYYSRKGQGVGYDGKWTVRVGRIAKSCIVEKICNRRYLTCKELLKKMNDPLERLSINAEWDNCLCDQSLAQDAFIRELNSVSVEEICHSLGYYHGKESPKDRDKVFSYVTDMEKSHDKNTV